MGGAGSGTPLLREGKSLSKVIASDFPEHQGRDTAGEGDLELIGHLMSPETQAALTALQLSSLHSPIVVGAGCCC